jgi:hypothetical protein
MKCKYLNYYYSEEEKVNYFNEWKKKCSENMLGYSASEYKIYEEITMENCHIDIIQSDHYLDEGCLCKACSLKRSEVASQIIRGLKVSNRIVHIEAKSEFLQKQVTQVNNINKVLQNIPKKTTVGGFKPNLKSLVK